jgi:hypothetical protein
MADQSLPSSLDHLSANPDPAVVAAAKEKQAAIEATYDEAATEGAPVAEAPVEAAPAAAPVFTPPVGGVTS